MEYELIHKEGMWVSGLNTELTTSQKENYKIIQKHWQRFNSVLRTRNLMQGKNWEKYGITQKINSNYNYLASIPLGHEVDGFETLEIAGGKYACFRHVGSMESIIGTIYNIYRRIIPESFPNIDEERTVLHYELYNHRFHWNQSDSIIEIYVPVDQCTKLN